MEYLDIIKSFIDNYKFSTIETPIYNSNGQLGLSPSNHIYNFLTHSFYETESGEIFHKKNIYDFLKTYNNPKSIDFNDIFKITDKIILQISLHPQQGVYLDKMLRAFLIGELVEKIKNGNVYLFFYYGWEADSFNDSKVFGGKSYYDVFSKILLDYNLPENGITIISSDMLGSIHENECNFIGKYVNVIYEPILECEVFRASNVRLNESFEEHIENIRKTDKTILRINRSPLLSRDVMLYILYNNFYDKSIIEHQKFNDDYNLIKNLMTYYLNVCKRNNLSYLEKYFTYNDNVIRRLEIELPMIASDFERSGDIPLKGGYTDAPIPHEVYDKTIFSWVSTTFPERPDYCFLSESTFSPILYYHPLLWYGGKDIRKIFIMQNYRSFDFLFNENYMMENESEYRMIYNVQQLHIVMNMNRDTLIQILISNKKNLIHNKNELIKCKSIENTLKKYYNILND